MGCHQRDLNPKTWKRLLLFPYNLYSTYRSQLSEIFHSQVLLAAECEKGGIEKSWEEEAMIKTLYTIFNFEIALVCNIVHLILTKPGILGGAPILLQNMHNGHFL